MVISVSYGFVGGVITVTNAKSSAESEKFTLKIRSGSGKLFTIGCHFPPKSTNFRTLLKNHGLIVFILMGGELSKREGCFSTGGRSVQAGAHPGGEGPAPPLGPENTIFSGFLPLNYVICIFEVCFFKLFAMQED